MLPAHQPASRPPRTLGQEWSARPDTGPATNPGTVAPDALRRLAQLTLELKLRIRTLLDLSTGQRVLDVGCGTGADTTAVARQVGHTGLAAGIDYDASMIRHARTTLANQGPAPLPSLLVADAAAIPYRTAVFDGCYCERVLQHVQRPAAVVRDMVRVTKPGGRIVIADTDWATLSIDTPESYVERALVRFAGESLRNGYAGRQLRRLMRDAGIEDVRVELWPLVWTDYHLFRTTSLSLLDLHRRAVLAGVISRADLARLHGSLNDADRQGAFFASGTIVLAHGRRPGQLLADTTHQEAS